MAGAENRKINKRSRGLFAQCPSGAAALKFLARDLRHIAHAIAAAWMRAMVPSPAA